VRGNGVEALYLSDRSCPDLAVGIDISDEIAGKPDVAPLVSAIYRQGYIGTVGKRIRATIVGDYEGKRWKWLDGMLYVKAVHDLEVTILPTELRPARSE
jgi:hypothetical protein